MSRSHPLLVWAPVVAWMIVIFLASAQPRLPLQDDVPDFVSHSMAYLVLSVLWCWALARAGAPTPRIALAAVLASALYGATDEWHQSFVPGRHSEVRDVRNDTLGAAAGAALYWSVFAALRRRGAARAS